jgi:uncharacterized protein YukE
VATYNVDMTQVEYIVGEMTSITQQLTSTLEDLDSQSKVKLSEWSSDAQSVYAEVKAQWDAAAADMTAKAQAAAGMLGTINSSYSDGERQGMNIWGK